ncbi:DUF1572 family protein [Chryseobacterium koreense]|uniref:DUF1572 domain-containing protein n=1 Tax=Chryseobacterium koreense CCUG 49689 TaxID=1304281 RepID=A0A0J7IXX2_9FLAO|nr:DUF1572 family protein [Chryseobacterium koreense]KMQ70676.1 hypothetical protein ACM44_10975 [Chryseobacterium koreense CCUG 49689]MBB5334525.1 putative damage-inducible protein DinB [Chryseobacterium koreense]
MKDLFIKRFLYYKELGDKTFEQLNDEEVLLQYNPESNSIATIVKHISGNMLSRWTNFLTEDGEKDWRNRDSEFENDLHSKSEMLEVWEKGWKVFIDSLNQITDETWQKEITIRGEKHSVLDAVLRQLAHYPYHIGQIVYVAKMLKDDKWKTLSIARNKSEEFNIEILKKHKPEEIQQNSSPVCYAKSNEIRDDYKI